MIMRQLDFLAPTQASYTILKVHQLRIFTQPTQLGIVGSQKAKVTQNHGQMAPASQGWKVVTNGIAPCVQRGGLPLMAVSDVCIQ